MNDIHNTSIIGENVKFGINNRILPNTIIYGPTSIGDNNIIGPNVVIGTPGQDTKNPRYDSSECQIKIGNNNIIREFTAIQKPCYRNITKLGNDIFLMQSVHIPHDAIIEDKVVITPMCVLAGITHLCEGCNIGMGATIHQHSVIGQYSLVGTGSAITKNLPPFSIYVPQKKLRVNNYAIKKFGFIEYIDEINKFFIDGIIPNSSEIGEMFEYFFQLHGKSKRAIYQ